MIILTDLQKAAVRVLNTPGIGPAVAQFGAYVEVINSSNGRLIASLPPDVAIEETHSDELVITDHPVSSGAPITDHAYKRPASVSVTWGWSESSRSAFVAKTPITDVYDTLLGLQSDRELITLQTGKRSYENMLIESISSTTSVDTENVLIVNMTLREVIIAESVRVSPLPAPKKMQQPQTTQIVTRQGTLNLIPR